MRAGIAFALALGSSLLLGGCKERPDDPPAPIRPVLSVVARSQPESDPGFAGTVEPRYRSNLGFRVLGRIIARDVNVGDDVRKGARVAALDPVTFEHAVRSAQADLSNAQARLENAIATEARQQALIRGGSTTQAQLELAQQAREAAAAAVSQARANLTRAEEQLGYTQLWAEFNGIVTSVEAEVGQVVQPGQTVVGLARPDVREAIVDLPEELAGALKTGTRFEVALQLDPSLRASGEVREIAPQADAATRTRRIRITISNAPPSFRLGTMVTARPVMLPAPGIELPASALLEGDGKTFVWVVDPHARTVSLREVKISERTERSFRVVDGLPPRARVVTAGVNSLTPGQVVKLMDEDF